MRKPASVETLTGLGPGAAVEGGAAATGRLQDLLNEGAFTLEPINRDRDQYGRLLRTVTRDGERSEEHTSELQSLS